MFKFYLRIFAALACFLFSNAASAVIAVDNISTIVDNNPTSLTVSHTTGAGSDMLMIVAVSFNNNDFETVISVTYNGTGLNFVGEISRSNDSRVEIWSYLNPPVTTANVVVTFNEQVQRGAVLGVITFTGVDQLSPFGAFQSNTGNSTTASATVTSAGGETVIGVMAAEQQDNTPVVVGGNELWSLKSQNGNNRTVGAAATYTGAPSVNLAWNLNEPDDWVVGAISLRPSGTVSTAVGFCDNFESGLGNWTITSGGGDAGISGATFNSPGNSLYTRWNPVTVTNNADIAALGLPYQLSLWIRRGADSFSEDPDNGEDFMVQYLNNAFAWVTLETFAGNGTPGQIYERNYSLPANARHNNLRVRVQQVNGSGVNWDYWHVDDVCLLEITQPDIELRMDEQQWNGTANEIFDSSGNGNSANANAASGLSTINPGQICRAGSFDGVDDYVESSDIFSYLRTTASMSFWIKTTQSGDNVGWRAPGVAGAELSGGTDDIFWGWLDAGGRIGISVADDFTSKSATSINDGVYHHVVLTRDATSGDYKIYIDGVLDASGTIGAGIIGTPFASIGRIEDTGGTPEYLQGDLDEVLVFNYVLSDGAVTSIYTNQINGKNLDGSNRTCPGALAWFQLDADAGVWNGTPGEIIDQMGSFTGAFALGTGAGVDSVLAQVCRGIDIPFNNSNGAQYGFDSNVDIDDDVGSRGTVSFWYRSNNDWVGGGDRMLIDASPNDFPGPDKYFYLVLRNNGSLRFALEDTADGDYNLTTGTNSILAGVWTHIAVTWDMSSNLQIYINGALAASQAFSTNGQIGELRTLYFGDNRSTYHPGGTANSANGVIDEARVHPRVQTMAEIVTDMNAVHACAAGAVDHFSITPATTLASTCLANAITIIAEDASNNPVIDYTGQVSITTSSGNGNWSVNDADNVLFPSPDNDDNGQVNYSFLVSDVGEIILDLTNTHAETLTITVADTATAISSTSVAISYNSNIFVINEDPIQVAGRPQAMTVEMWTDDLLGSGSCGIDTNFNNANQSIEASIDRAGILIAAADPTISAVTIPDGPATATLSLDFSLVPGQASFNLDTTDVGQYRLSLSDITLAYSDTIINGVGAQLTVRPFGLAVTSIEAGPGPTPNPAGTLPGDAIFTTAGADFSATFSAVLWSSADDTNNDGVLDTGVYSDNAPAPGYAWNTTLAVVTTGGYTPNPGTPGSLNIGLVSQAQFGGGFAIVNNLQYSEVGSFTLLANADNFLGEPSADLVSDGDIVGRFVPAMFAVSLPGASNGLLGEACGGFTYIGQDFTYDTAPTFTVTAQNLAGVTTMQYRDGFAKLNAGSISVDVSQDSTTLGTGPSPLLLSYSVAAMIPTVQNDGTVDYVFGADTFRFGKFPNSQVDEFTADIEPEITSVTDGEVTTNYAAGTNLADPDGNVLRFGRLAMDNVHGSELDPLLMPSYVEYWDAGGWLKSSADTCTMIADADLDIPPGGISVPTVVNPLPIVGNINYSFPAPGAGNVGFIDTTTDLNSALQLWLQYDWDNDGNFDNDPGARATFGIYGGDSVQIFIQQTFEQ